MKKPNAAGLMGLILVLFLHTSGHAASPKPSPQRVVLENGLTLILEQDDSSAITFLQILIRGGKRVETADMEGLTYLTTRLTLEIPDQTSLQQIMNQATSMRMDSRFDFSFINIGCLTENLEDTLKLITKIMFDPLFSGPRINGRKEQMAGYRQLEEDDAPRSAHNAARELFFLQTPYAGSIYGTDASLKNIKGRDIKSFFQKAFTGGNMIIAGSSDLSTKELESLLRRFFERLPSGDALTLSEVKPTVPPEKTLFIAKDAEQSLVEIAFPLPPLSRENFCTTALLEDYLGQGVASRLWPLRSREKLAYTVASRATQLEAGGLLEAFLETENEKKDRALSALRENLESLYREGMTAEDLDMTKRHTRTSFLRENEPKENRTFNYAAFEASGLGCGFVGDFPQEIESITLEEMNAAIRKIMDPEKAVTIVVGAETVTPFR